MAIGKKNALYTGPSLPLNIRQPKAQPTTQNFQQLLMGLKAQQTKIASQLKSPPPPPQITNFTAQAQVQSVFLSWGIVNTPGLDGYILFKSPSSDFEMNVTKIPLSNVLHVTYVDSVPTGTKVYYRIQATGGTKSQPQSVIGPISVTVSATAL